ncbi:hypothetical protein SAMN04488005_0670 [Yoonia tamlensis]|uniref:N-acetyltransferase domain-containing protein n=1 Tax=Yoonia tamlensis TaxID=390270 RepID=A0A1I6FXA5_9RHOB|nr:GNAT family protein [Yoonia tamlensis]SFR34546.1 hypothetical protein SAMN04488005_0670 [Yoonia tamlensis]
MKTTRPAPPFMIDTPVGRVRSLRPSDVTDTLVGWYQDAAIMGPVNMAPQSVTKADMRAYVASFDNRSKMILGLFAKQENALIGLVLCEISQKHGSVRISLVVGNTSRSARRAIIIGLPILIEGLFLKRGFEKITAHVTGGNEAVGALLARAGMQVEGVLRGQLRAAPGSTYEKDGRSRLDQTLYGVLKTDWENARQNR